MKSLAMMGLNTFSLPASPVLPSHSSQSPYSALPDQSQPHSAPNSGKGVFHSLTAKCGWGLGRSSNLLQRVWSESSRQACLGAFSPQNEVSGNDDFRLNFPLASTPVHSNSSRPTSTTISPHPRHKAPRTRESGCSLPWLRSGHIHSAYDVWMSVWTSSGTGLSSPLNVFVAF